MHRLFSHLMQLTVSLPCRLLTTHFTVEVISLSAAALVWICLFKQVALYQWEHECVVHVCVACWLRTRANLSQGSVSAELQVHAEASCLSAWLTHTSTHHMCRS